MPSGYRKSTTSGGAFVRWFRRLPVALLAAFIVGTLLFSVGASSSVTTLTYTADADATIRADRPTRSYGTTNALTVDNSPIQDSLLRFVVTGIGTDVVTGGTLRLYVTNASPVGGTLYRVQNQSWTEGVTWATAPAGDQTPTTTAGKATASTWMTFDVTSLIKGDGKYSVRIKSSSSDGAGYTSREGTSAQRPQLVVTKATTADTSNPTASITAPTGGTVAGQNSVTVNAGDNIGVTSVDVAVDGTVIGSDATSPYAVPWDTTKTPNGTHALTAIAHDAAGNIGTSTPVSVSVSNDTTKPTATITAPTGGTVSGQTSVTVDAGDNIGVTSVDVAVDGTVVGSDTTSPYAVPWDTTKTPNGTRALTAIAHDAAGNTGTSGLVSVTVGNVLTDMPPTPPTVLRTSAVGPLQVTLSWTASTDDFGVTSYEVFRDAAKIGTTTTTSFTDATVGAGAAVSYVVVALDTAGQRSGPSLPLGVTTPSDTQPSFPIRAAFYYPWYPETWGNLAAPETHFHPSAGFYDSSTPSVIATHISQMQNAKISAGLASWWGQGSATNGRISTLLRAADSTSFRWGLYYEPEGYGDPSVTQIQSDLAYITSTYGRDTNYVRVNGKPVLFVDADANDGCGMADRWKQANTYGVYVMLKAFSGYATCASQPDGWHQYGPASPTHQVGSDSYSISPGLWLNTSATPLLDRDLTTWNQSIRSMIASGARWQLITTFNQWGEGTAIEPAAEWSNAYLDALHNDGVVSSTSFTFAAAGDHGANARTTASLFSLNQSPAAFYLALGDMSYNETPSEQAWCDYVHANLPAKGAVYPFQVVTGNHEADNGDAGRIQSFAGCLPDHLGATAGPGGMYGAEYAVDYPTAAPLARFIMISPELTVSGVSYHYVPGNPHYDWLTNEIDSAHAAGIQWVIVGMHFPCLSTGQYSCVAGPALMNLLMSHHVDLVLHGHDHDYQRSKQLALNATTCPSIAGTGYTPGCVVDDGFDGIYPKGAGTVDVVAGTFGRSLYATNPVDPEAPYFVKLDSTTNGYMLYTVAADRLDARFVPTTGTMTDAFSIVSGATPSADLVVPSAPGTPVADTSVPGRVGLIWAASSDDVALRNYAVLRDGIYIGSTTTAAYTDSTVVGGTTYSYAVTAYDTAGNPSATSAPVSVTVPIPATLTFVSDADASIYSASPTMNHGAATSLEVDNSPIKNFLVRFTVTGVGARTVTAAKLRLACVDPSPRGGDFTLAAITPWTESTVNWGTAPVAGTVFASLGAVVAGTTYEIDLSSVIHGDGTYTLRIITPNSDGADYVSKEGATASRPQLIVTTAP
jgi:hypothetical protein